MKYGRYMPLILAAAYLAACRGPEVKTATPDSSNLTMAAVALTVAAETPAPFMTPRFTEQPTTPVPPTPLRCIPAMTATANEEIFTLLKTQQPDIIETIEVFRLTATAPPAC